eukprot:4482454-Alexandrium_andersonii.AAC.1
MIAVLPEARRSSRVACRCREPERIKSTAGSSCPWTKARCGAALGRQSGIRGGVTRAPSHSTLA